MNIFDNYERTYQLPSTRHESVYSFLNRSARPAFQLVRNELERWFGHYPIAHKAELLARIKCEFWSPFFELLLHEIFVRLKSQVTVHPKIGSKHKHPEFLAEFSKRQQLVVEATCSQDDLRAERGQKRISQVLDAIDQIESPYFYVSVDRVKESDRKQIAPSRVVAFLERELRQLDPEKVMAQSANGESLPQLEFVDGSSHLNFTVIPKNRERWDRENSRVVGMHSVGSRWGGNEDRLCRVLENKGKHYGTMQLPFLIAVNTLDPFGSRHEDRLAALFGSRQQYVAAFTDELCERILENGFWGTSSNPKYTRVSCVLMGTALPWNVPRIDFCLYMNPWAEIPVFDFPWPFPIATMINSELVYKKPNCDLSELLELPKDWPGPMFDNE